MHARERCVFNEAMQRLQSEGELAECHRAFCAETALLQAREVLRSVVIWAVDDPQIFAATAFNRRLEQPLAASCNELERLDDHTLIARLSHLFPPGDCIGRLLSILDIDDAILRRQGDALIADDGDRYDLVLTNPPFGKRQSFRIVNAEGAIETERQDYTRPHPAARRLLNLRQNDLLAVERNGGPRELLRVSGFNVQGRLTLAAANEGGNLKERDGLANETDPFKYVYLSGRSVVKAKARQVRIDPLGRVFDPGPRE